MAEPKRRILTIGDKIEIIRELDSGASNVSICRKLSLNSSTVSTIWKNRSNIIDAFEKNKPKLKKIRNCDKVDLNDALLSWFQIQKNSNIPICGSHLKVQAEKFAKQMGYVDFVCNNGWLERFKNRNRISYNKMNGGESEDVNRQITEGWIENVWSKIRDGYPECDIFSADEFGLYFKMTPNMTHNYKGEKCSNGELPEERLTVFICSNLCGTEKRQLLVIGKAQNPKCFQNVKNLPVKYRSNMKAWMTPNIFEEELLTWDIELWKKKRYILLILDNCPSHHRISNLTNIKLIFLPPNSTSILQPINQGVIRSFKCNFRQLLLIDYLEFLKKKDTFKISILDAIRYMNEAWETVTSQTIRNYFLKSGLTWNRVGDNEEDTQIGEDGLLLSIWAKKLTLEYDIGDFEEYINVDNNIATAEIPTDEDIISTVKQQVTFEEHNIVEDDNIDDCVVQISPSEAQAALKTLSMFYETNEVDIQFLSHLQALKNEVQMCYLKTLETTHIKLE